MAGLVTPHSTVTLINPISPESDLLFERKAEILRRDPVEAAQFAAQISVRCSTCEEQDPNHRGTLRFAQLSELILRMGDNEEVTADYMCIVRHLNPNIPLPALVRIALKTIFPTHTNPQHVIDARDISIIAP